MTAMERVRNLHELLVLSYTQSGYDIIKPIPILSDRRISIRNWRDCIKLQLSFEKWVHDHNPIEDVQNAQPLVATMI